MIAKRSSRSLRPRLARRRDRLLAEAQRLVQLVARHRQLEPGVEREQSLLVGGRRLLDRLDRGAGLRAEVVGRERAGPAQQRLEALGRKAGALEAARRLGEQAALLGERRGPARTLGRRQEGRARRPPLARLDPVLRQPRRLALALLQERGDLGVELARHRRRHRGERRFVDQVVHEGAVAQHLRLLELGARVGEIEGAQAEHVRRELDREVGRGDRGAARQPHRVGRQVGDAPLDHRVQRAGERQPRRQGAVAAAAAAADPGLERLEQVERIAAAVPEQRRRDRSALQRLDAERIDDLGDVARASAARAPRARPGPRANTSSSRVRPAIDTSAARAVTIQRRLDAPIAYCSSSMLVSSAKCRSSKTIPSSASASCLERGADGVEEARPSFAAGQCRRLAQLGQQPGEGAPQRQVETAQEAGGQGAQQPCRGGVDDPAVAGPRADDERAARAPGAKSPTSRLLPMPPSPLTTALRPASQASCSARHAASRPIRRGGSSTLAGRPWAGAGNAGTPAALIVASSASVSRRRRRADLVLQHLLAAVEREQGRGAVALQVEHADHAAVRGFGERLEGEQLARVRPARRRSRGPARPRRRRLRARPDARRRRGARAAGPARRPARGRARRPPRRARCRESARSCVDARGQRQRRVAADQLDAELAPQLEQALAQGVAGRLGRALRPEQRGQPGARRRPLERQPGEQRGIARGERHRGLALAQQRRRLGEGHQQGTRFGGHRSPWACRAGLA